MRDPKGKTMKTDGVAHRRGKTPGGRSYESVRYGKGDKTTQVWEGRSKYSPKGSVHTKETRTRPLGTSVKRFDGNVIWGYESKKGPTTPVKKQRKK